MASDSKSQGSEVRETLFLGLTSGSNLRSHTATKSSQSNYSLQSQPIKSKVSSANSNKGRSRSDAFHVLSGKFQSQLIRCRVPELLDPLNPLGAVRSSGSIFPTLSNNNRLVRNASSASVKSLQTAKRNYSTASLSAQDSNQ